MTRINKARIASRAAYANNRKKTEQMILAWQNGVDIDPPADINVFDVQINHLLMCLQNTMVIISSIGTFCLLLSVENVFFVVLHIEFMLLKQVLKSILCLIGSQRSVFRIGVICLYVAVPVMALATEF